MSEDGIKRASELLKDSAKRAFARRVGMTHVEGKKDGRHYAFIGKDSTSVATAKLQGYSTVQAAENKEMVAPAAIVEDGAFVLGDTVLMETPQELFDINKREELSRTDSLLRRVKDGFHKEGEKLGIKTFEEGESEIGESNERARDNAIGKKVFSMGAGINAKGEVVK